MKFILTSYRKDSDSPACETDVSYVGVESLAKLFGFTADSLVDTYPLDKVQAAALGRLTGMTFDMDHHEYFLEAEAEAD
ncbi:hypothetical protein ABZ557_31420 [Streptomyces sp. NPDC019645]|uniref:DUF7683 domain-containing protein n=1 Tax=Streptomyces sp. NPDC019645 TaxID=3154786 RepID=UPI0033FE2D6C